MAKFCNHCRLFLSAEFSCGFFNPPKKLEFSYNNDLKCPKEEGLKNE